MTSKLNTWYTIGKVFSKATSFPLKFFQLKLLCESYELVKLQDSLEKIKNFQDSFWRVLGLATLMQPPPLIIELALITIFLGLCVLISP
jgi:hypothetical protein